MKLEYANRFTNFRNHPLIIGLQVAQCSLKSTRREINLKKPPWVKLVYSTGRFFGDRSCYRLSYDIRLLSNVTAMAFVFIQFMWSPTLNDGI